MEDSEAYTIEKEFNPQAILDYYHYYDNNSIEKKGNIRDFQMKAKQHLAAMGWYFYWIYKSRGSRELRYCPPNSTKIYSTLMMACKGYLENEITTTNVKDSKKKKRKRSEDDDYVPDLKGKLSVDLFGSLGGKSLNVASDYSSNGSCVIDSVSHAEKKFESAKRVKRQILKGVNNDLVTQNLGQKQNHDVKNVARDLGHNQNGDDKNGSVNQNIGYNQNDETKTNTVDPKKRKRKRSEEEEDDDDYVPDLKRKFCVESFRNSDGKILNAVNDHPLKRRSVLSSVSPAEKKSRFSKRVKRQNCVDNCLVKGTSRQKQNQNQEVDNGSLTQNLEQNKMDDGVNSGLVPVSSGQNENNDAKNGLVTQNLGQVPNDEVCSVCLFGGEIVLCDQCPSSFHPHCLGMSEVPNTDFWYCPSCCCRICGLNIPRDDSETSTNKRCDQCEKQYHRKCVSGYRVADSEKSKWFCSKKCWEISYSLSSLLGKPVLVERSLLTWTVVKDESNLNECDTNSILRRALVVMHECFESVEQPGAGERDVLEDVIFSRSSELKRLDFRGFYTVVLMKGKNVVTAATVRVFGEEVAEVPLIGTRFKYRRLGLCKILMDMLEQKLIEFGVKKLVLPAISSALDTWTSPSFGFSKATEVDRLALLNYTFLEFPHTVICQKLLSEKVN